MTGAVRTLLLALALCLAPLLAAAQDLGSLVADRISVDPAGRITAEGNVVFFYQGTRLTAASVTYDRRTDRLSISGPIRVTEADGTIFLAEEAELDADLRNGLLTSARLVLDGQLQLAASEIARVEGRYTRLDRVVASSCEVCIRGQAPLWEIRAARVVHDTQRQQLYFDQAQLRVAGLPVLYLPRLRLPDPTLKRATGLLIPQFRSTSDLGTGLKLPYFIALGDHADVTLTPYLSTETRTLEYRYRHIFPRAVLEATGAVSNDNVDGDRGYLFADGLYRLPGDFLLHAQIEAVSDPGYLFLYNYSDKDRLTNQIDVSRVSKDERFRASATGFRTLRSNEIPVKDTLPDRLYEVFYERDLPALSFGGRATASVSAAALTRPSSADADGRDVSRIGAAIDWRRDWIIGPGLLATAEAGLRVDNYTIGQDAAFAQNLTRFVPRAAAELRWPFARTNADGSRDVIEPILRFDFADTGGDTVPLEDSRVVEFDEANLFSPSRYPGVDGIEDGSRVALGFTWRREDPDGWQADIAFGRLAHLTSELGYAEGSGLEGDKSEWLVAGRLAIDDHLWLMNRSLLGEELIFTLSETRIDWKSDRWAFGSSYLFARPEPAEDRPDQLSEWSFEGSYDITDRWRAGADWRYDFTAGRAARAGLEMGYRTECVEVSLSVSRRYASSTSVDPTTDFGVRVALLGVGGKDAGARTRSSCRG